MKKDSRFHGYFDRADEKYGIVKNGHGQRQEVRITVEQRELVYDFSAHFHPYVAALINRLLEKSVAGLQAADTDYVRQANGDFEKLPDGKNKPVLYQDFFFARYNPAQPPANGANPLSRQAFVDKPYPVKDLDFTTGGAYSVYNWELFFHVPLTLAIHLSKNGQYAEAQRWFHYVFDPTDDSDGETPQRFWKVRPFQYTEVKLIQEILTNLASNADPALRDETVHAIEAWKSAPFRPHVVARYRQSAYMFKTVMAYLDNLIAWGDSLFRQYTGESINEATQLYVLAANILGTRPQPVPTKGSQRPQTYASLRKELDEFSNALADLEAEVPFDLAPLPVAPADANATTSINSLGKALYFCVPRNDKLLGYWETVADRLYKIHNSLTIEGVFRPVPLFEPRIDPALLAQAAATGLDIGAIISGANQPLPLVRFQLLIQKAAEIAQEVKALGSSLLSAMEKEDNEALAILRARHERAILELAETVKYQQWQEAVKAREALENGLATAAERYVYYQRLLGRQESEIRLPEMDPLDKSGLDLIKFRANEPEVDRLTIPVDIAQGVAGISGGKKVSSFEAAELEFLQGARQAQDAAAAMDLIGSFLALIPEFGGQAEPMGVGAALKFGGQNLSRMLGMMAQMTRTSGDQLSYQANRAAKIGSYDRREQEWTFQSNLAADEMNQIYKQLRAAQIHENLAEREWKNHQQEILNAKAIESFLTNEREGKPTNQALYAWMKREVRGLYSQCFQFAFDVARQAERALQYELGDPNQSFIEYGYLTGKQGLLAGEKLYLDVKRMELAYHDLNQREYELTKHVSLMQVDPVALLQLRATGRCVVALPEELFDLDAPGHYFRRLKSVAVTVPCVTGPYTSVNCKLTLLKSSIRTSPQLSDGNYARGDAEDSRFADSYGALQSIVTSGGQNDSGLFETNLRDDRYLPFEGLGAIGEWRIELPSDIRQFDYGTISDVILHIRYTAREGGELLKSGAVSNLQAQIAGASAVGSMRLFSLQREFPSEWHKFKGIKLGGGMPFAELSLVLREEHYPFWSKTLDKALNDTIALKSVRLFAKPTDKTKATITLSAQPNGGGNVDQLDKDPSLRNLLAGKLKNIARPNPTGKVTLFLDDNTMDDLWLAVTWGAKN